MNNPTLHLIGIVRSSLKSLEDCPLQGTEGAPEAILEIKNEYAAGLKGVKKGSSLVLLTWLHAGDRTTLQCYPRNEKDSPVIGVFATRSPSRPNPIGLHHVKIVEVISHTTLKVFPLEVLDGTPLLDIKPDLIVFSP